MKRRTVKKPLLVMATLSILIGNHSVLLGWAQDQETINQLETEIASKEEYMASLTATKEELLAEIDTLRAHIIRLGNEKAVAESTLQLITADLEQINNDMVVLQEKINKRSLKIAEQAQYLQTDFPSTDLFSLMMTSTSFADLVSRMSAASEILTAHETTLAEQKKDETALSALRDEMTVKQQEAEAQRNAIALAENNARLGEIELADKIDIISEKYALTEQEKGALESQHAAAIEAKRKADEERARQEAAAKAEAERLAQEAAARQAAQQTVVSAPVGQSRTVSSSGLIVPAQGIISSPFGPRLDPITGVPSFHKGLDIAGSGPIIAAQSGTVTTVSYNSIYGYYVDIVHPDGMMTRYAHLQSNLQVTTGQQVSQGQVLGTMGTTGYSTGVHLHFEVWVNGSYVDPALYLPL